VFYPYDFYLNDQEGTTRCLTRTYTTNRSDCFKISPFWYSYFIYHIFTLHIDHILVIWPNKPRKTTGEPKKKSTGNNPSLHAAVQLYSCLMQFNRFSVCLNDKIVIMPNSTVKRCSNPNSYYGEWPCSEWMTSKHFRNLGWRWMVCFIFRGSPVSYEVSASVLLFSSYSSSED
jgi:hypothetical protein